MCTLTISEWVLKRGVSADVLSTKNHFLSPLLIVSLSSRFTFSGKHMQTLSGLLNPYKHSVLFMGRWQTVHNAA